MRSLVVILAVAALTLAPLALAGDAAASAKPDFSKLDKNADGELTMVEIDGCVMRYPELGMVREAFVVIDADQDGIVSVSEYDAWIPMTEEEVDEVME